MMIPETEAALKQAFADCGVTGESHWLHSTGPKVFKINLGPVFGHRICAWCGKDLGPYEGEGDTHSGTEEK